MKVAELTGAQLDYWVARADGRGADEVEIIDQGANPVSPRFYASFTRTGAVWWPSSKWNQGGPIIEREQIAIETGGEGKDNPRPPTWYAICDGIFDRGQGHQGEGPTPLIAAMRAYVASKFGDEVPDEAG